MHTPEDLSTSNWIGAASLLEFAKAKEGNQRIKSHFLAGIPVTGGIHIECSFHWKPFTLVSQSREQDQAVSVVCGCVRIVFSVLTSVDSHICMHSGYMHPSGINTQLCCCLEPGTCGCSSLTSITLPGWTTPNTRHYQKYKPKKQMNYWYHRQAFSKTSSRYLSLKQAPILQLPVARNLALLSLDSKSFGLTDIAKVSILWPEKNNSFQN